MSGARYACCDERRLGLVAGHPSLNAIDYLEVGDLSPANLDAAEAARYAALPPDRRGALLWQRRLTLRFVNPLTAEQTAGLAAGAIVITGGERITRIAVDVLSTLSDALVLRASQAGDFSRYTLTLARAVADDRPPRGFDPILSTVEFAFKVDCPSDFDCRTETRCEPEPEDAPPLDYLAKDYASFRRLILDRMALLVPEWRERNPADLGVTLVELLAYVGDQLSYQQDAVATEAYLRTARRRPSVRRHALLVDYRLGEGANARAWLHVEVSADVRLDPQAVFCTAVEGADARIVPDSAASRAAREGGVEWFAPVAARLGAQADPVDLFADHGELHFHTWGDDRCCLPRGATRATLAGHHPQLAAGMPLMFEEVKGSRTGVAEDADPAQRHVVRLTEAAALDGAQPLTDPLDGSPITEIAWDRADALPFPLCLSSRTEEGDDPVAAVSVARGNLVLVDHGREYEHALGVVPEPRLVLAGASGCDAPPPEPVPPRFRPELAQRPLTRTATVADVSRRARFVPGAPAATVFVADDRDAAAAIAVTSEHNGEVVQWDVAADLLDARPDSVAFVVETEADGAASLRFGDGVHGRSPLPGETFHARYRVGNGPAGNVGADAIAHVISGDARLLRARNPLPARGGRLPESLEQARRRAPQAFRRQERAVTTADYEEVATRHPGLQRAAASLRWTGSWNTVFLTVDREDGAPLDDDYEAALTAHVDRYRMAGYDVALDEPRFVSLELELFVCVASAYLRGDVERRLRSVLSNRRLPDGTRGLFHPDNLTFGQTVHLSPILARARNVAGVDSVSATSFGRQGAPDPSTLLDGRIALGRLEIARLDNDPNYPERGKLAIRLSGGR